MAKLKNQKSTRTDQKVEKWQGGRPRKDEQNSRSYLYAFRLNEKENLLFEQFFEKSGAHTKTQFITNCIFQRPFQVVVTDKGAMEVCIKLSEINFEIRKVGVNYNQVTKAINTTFTEPRVLSSLGKIQSLTLDMILHLKKVIEITEQYKQKWLSK